MPVPTQSSYPNTLDTVATLLRAYNQKEFTLASDIDSTTTSVPVSEDLTGIDPYFIIVFETGELIMVESVDTTNRIFTVVRGILGNNQSHNSAEKMRGTVAAEYFELHRSAIIAMQTELGTLPKGSFGDVKARLENIESRIESHDHTGSTQGVAINAATVDGFSAYAVATANHLLALDADSKLPASITGDADTVDGQHASYFQRKGALQLDDGGEKTIVSGAIAVTSAQYSRYTVDTEADATSDILDNISGGAVDDVIIISPAHADRHIYLSTSGNILQLPNRPYYRMTHTGHHAILRSDGTNWHIIGGVFADVKVMQLEVFSMRFDEPHIVGDGLAFFYIPDLLDGFELIKAEAKLSDAGTGNLLQIQLYNEAAAGDMLSTRLSIDPGEWNSLTAASQHVVVSTSYRFVTGGTCIRVDIDTIHTTPGEGLIITIYLQEN